MATFTITVHLAGGALTYTGSDPSTDGETVSATRHHIFKNCKVRWICQEGDLFISFLGSRSPFQNKGPNVFLTAPMGTHTATLTVKNKSKDSIKYIVGVETPRGSGVGVFEDPILEDGGDPGGGGPKGKSAKKPAAKKKKKK